MKVGVTEKGHSGTEHICSECGNAMTEVDRASENGFTFIWYQCARVGCEERWLEKKAILRLPENSEKARICQSVR